MRVLLDTHTFVWWTLDDVRLSNGARAAIGNSTEAFVSLVTPWEIAIKVGKGKWPEAKPTLDDFEQIAEKANLGLLTTTVEHVRLSGLMPSPHRDPFDRLMAAQAITEGLTLVTSDAKLASLGADCLW